MKIKRDFYFHHRIDQLRGKPHPLDIVANPKIKIVFINNAGTKSIQDLIAKAHPDIEVIQFDA